jgi:hypothetical protein
VRNTDLSQQLWRRVGIFREQLVLRYEWDGDERPRWQLAEPGADDAWSRQPDSGATVGSANARAFGVTVIFAKVL